MASRPLPISSSPRGLLLLLSALLLSHISHSWALSLEDMRVLTVGAEKVGETMPLQHGRRFYRLAGLRPSTWYEVKISYPASIPSSFSIRLVDDPLELWPTKNRRLLNTEKIIFKAQSSNPVYDLVMVEPDGVVAKPNVPKRELALFNIGLKEWFSQSDESHILPRIPVMVNMASSVSSKKGRKAQDNLAQTNLPTDQSRHSTMLDEESDEDEDFQLPETEQESSFHKPEADVRRPGLDEEASDRIDLSGFSGNLRQDDRANSRDCWRISDGSNCRVRSKKFLHDKSKAPAGKHLMELVAVDWFKDVK